MALKSQGVTLGIGPSPYDIVGQVQSITGIGSGTAAEIDVTNLSSDRIEVLMGLPDEGSVTVGGTLDPADTTGQVAMRAARDAQALTEFQITLTNDPATTLTFPAFVTQFSVDINPNGSITFSSTLRITGAVVWA